MGKRLEQLQYANQDTDSQGRRILQVAALGVIDEVPIRWVYYHISNPEGRRMAYVFTMEADMAERFAGADQVLVGGLEFTARAETPEPTPAAASSKPRQPASTQPPPRAAAKPRQPAAFEKAPATGQTTRSSARTSARPKPTRAPSR